MLAISYWLVWGSIFIASGKLTPAYSNISIFAIGTGMGTFLAMLLYVLLGVFAKNTYRLIPSIWFSRMVGLLFWALAIVLLVQGLL